ncbi:MAG: crossover junction endodeoxyribonuclease RuvC [Candidatus Yonathbacteria bacterium]|nr:crossover junction endodeoxyribonuclease RuvC [Candidatus Yonathbacteria bacterium]
MRILSIDPGFDRVGIAVLEKQHGKDVVVHSSCIETDRKDSFPQRLVAIGSSLETVISAYSPDFCVVEELFFMTTNKTTAMRVAEARGVIIVTVARNNIPVHDLTPLQIKMAVTGYGRADKAQVNMMARKLAVITKEHMLDDEMDAIAAGIAGLAIFGKVTYPQM